MNLTVKSQGLFREKIKRMRQSASENKIAFTLKVPDSLIWWIWLEFGTGQFEERGLSNNPGGYTIEAAEGKFLYFENAKSGETEVRESVFMPGIPAYHMITVIEEDIQIMLKDFVKLKMQESQYDFSELKNAIELELMPEIKTKIIESFRERLPNHERDKTGRLDKSPADAFEEGLEIVFKEEG